MDDIDNYCRGTAVFVLPSRQEGLSSALIEAQSWGVPAVVSDIHCNSGVVMNGENALVVPVKDVRAFAHGIERLLNDASLRSATGRKASERMELDYYIVRIARQSMCEYLVANDVA